MQSRLAEATRRSCWLFSSPSTSAPRFPLKRLFCAVNRSKTADPDIHSGEQKPGYTNYRVTPQGTSTGDSDAKSNRKFGETEHEANKEEDIIYGSSKSPCEPSAKLKSTGVNQRLEPSIQQKRRKNGSVGLEDVSCAAGLDGSPCPWPEEERDEADNIEYYKHHKASPLSELEFADTRKPVSRTMHGTADSGKGGDVIGWLPEQVETAEETLLRAAEVWRQTAMRGDPDAPHSRVLRALRREDF